MAKLSKGKSHKDGSLEKIGSLSKAARVKAEDTINPAPTHKVASRGAGEEDLKIALESLAWRVSFERYRSIDHTRQSWTLVKKEPFLASRAG